MATPPDFTVGQILTASQMNAVGLWLVKTQTVVTGVSSVAVTNAFSADYDNYLLTYTGGNMSVSTAITLQLGSTTTGYYGNYIYGTNTGTTIAGANDNNTARFTYAGGNSDTVSSFIYAQIQSPFLASQTMLTASAVHYGSNFGNYNGVCIGTTSYTAFTLAPFSGTMTGGTIRVYGYRN